MPYHRESDISREKDESALQEGLSTGLNVGSSSDADDPSVVRSDVGERDVRGISEGGVGAGHDSDGDGIVMDAGDNDDADDPNIVGESSGSGGDGGGGRGRSAARHRGVEKWGRSRGKHDWAQTVGKKKKNLSKEYVSSRTHKVVLKREIGPACKDGCFQKIGYEKIKEIFYLFWDMGNYDQQNAHLISLISREEPKRKHNKNIRKARVN